MKIISVAVLLALSGISYAKEPFSPQKIDKAVGREACQISGDLKRLLQKCETGKKECCDGDYACNLRDRYYNVCENGRWKEGGKLPQELVQMDSGLKTKCDRGKSKCCAGDYACNYRDRYYNVCQDNNWSAGGQIPEELMTFRANCKWADVLKR